MKYKGKIQGDNYQIDKEPLLSIPIYGIKDTKSFETLVDYIIFLKQQENDTQSFYFEQIIDGMVYELYFKEEIKKSGCEIIKHLGNLPEIKEKMSDNEKQKIIDNAFYQIKDSPVFENLAKMKEVEEIKVIEHSLSSS